MLGGGGILRLPFTFSLHCWLSRRILWLHLYLYLSPLRCASCFSCPPAAKHLPLVVSRCRRLSRCHRLLSAGTPPPFASFSLAGCRDASRHVAAAASCPLKKPASFRDTVPSCLPLVCRLVVTLTPPPLLLLTCCLRLWARNLCLLTPLCLLSTGASPPVCPLFANWLLCCLSQRLRCFAPPFVALPPHV